MKVTCPNCDHIFHIGYKCIRCKRSWMPNARTAKAGQLPKACRFCKNPYWNKPRTRKMPWLKTKKNAAAKPKSTSKKPPIKTVKKKLTKK